MFVVGQKKEMNQLEDRGDFSLPWEDPVPRVPEKENVPPLDE